MQRREIEIVRRLVEDEQVAAAQEDFRNRETAALSAAEVLDAAIDRLIGEKVALQVTADMQLVIAEHDPVALARDRFHHALLIAEDFAILIHVIDHRARAAFHRTPRRFLLAENDAQQRGLACAIASDETDPRARRKLQREGVEQFSFADLHANIHQIEDGVSELRRRRDDEVHVLVALRAVLRGEFMVARDAVHALRAARARAFAHPFEFAREKLLPAAFRCLLARFALGFRREVLLVVAWIGIELPALQFDDARGDTVEKVAVVRDEKAGAGIAAQEIFQPLDTLRIEVVGRFVEDEKLWLCDERATECDATLLPTT